MSYHGSLERGGKASCILNINATWRFVASFTELMFQNLLKVLGIELKSKTGGNDKHFGLCLHS
jgi:hypothetical protein